MKVWENSNSRGNTRLRLIFPQLFSACKQFSISQIWAEQNEITILQALFLSWPPSTYLSTRGFHINIPTEKRDYIFLPALDNSALPLCSRWHIYPTGISGKEMAPLANPELECPLLPLLLTKWRIECLSKQHKIKPQVASAWGWWASG